MTTPATASAHARMRIHHRVAMIDALRCTAMGSAAIPIGIEKAESLRAIKKGGGDGGGGVREQSTKKRDNYPRNQNVLWEIKNKQKLGRQTIPPARADQRGTPVQSGLDFRSHPLAKRVAVFDRAGQRQTTNTKNDIRIQPGTFSISEPRVRPLTWTDREYGEAPVMDREVDSSAG